MSSEHNTGPKISSQYLDFSAILLLLPHAFIHLGNLEAGSWAQHSSDFLFLFFFSLLYCYFKRKPKGDHPF